MASLNSRVLIYTLILFTFTKEGLGWWWNNDGPDDDDTCLQNCYDGYLHHECSATQAIYGVQSYHNNYREDRIWNWKCRAASKPFTHCYWTGYENSYDDFMMFRCATNYVLRGVDSRHNNHHEDRRWKFQCCRATYHYTRNCGLSGFVNGYDGDMDFNAYSGYAIVGAFSIHDNGRE